MFILCILFGRRGNRKKVIINYKCIRFFYVSSILFICEVDFVKFVGLFIFGIVFVIVVLDKLVVMIIIGLLILIFFVFGIWMIRIIGWVFVVGKVDEDWELGFGVIMVIVE